jgi:radical SAM/Cys-rich protein
VMEKEIVEAILAVLQAGGIGTLDITGGAPEMNPHFVYLVEEAGKTGCRVIIRTNLTIFFENGMEYLPEFMSSRSVEVIASLPYYTENDVDRVRGKGTFGKCVEALRRLNSLGYGKTSGDKKLNLVYNPGGPFLPPPQKTLEDDYRRELGRRFGVSFDALYTFTNMPIGRFRDYLVRTGGLGKYMEKLVCAFNPETVHGLMCRHLVNVGWDGKLYDCDFNQLLGLTVHSDCPQDIREFDLSHLAKRTVAVGDHCYACTAGQGST